LPRYDYATAQDIIRSAVAGFTAVVDDVAQPDDRRRHAREARDAAAATLQRMRTATDSEVDEIGHQYAAIVAAQNR